MAGLIPFNKKNGTGIGFTDLHNMLDDFFSDSFLMQRNLARDTFKIDVEETPTAYNIQAEMPGIKKEEIALSLNEEGRLSISVNKEENVSEESKNYIHKERRTSSMSRCVYLDKANPEGIKAKLADGVLSIIVEKEEKKEGARAINIE